MGSLAVPTVRIDTINAGVSPVTNPSNLLLELGGVLYNEGYFYNNDIYQRQIFPTYDASNNNIYLKVITVAFTGNVEATSFTNVKVHVIG
jgi:hypothetical protein